jgi:23S rRNA (uracil1939-C5)-methyltransferase
MTSSVKTKLKIQKLDYRGQGISWDLDRITFIPQALPGEEVEIKLTKIHAKEQWGVVTKICQASPQRITPACPHFANCAGCHYLHLAYPDELAAKTQVLQDHLAHIAKINPATIHLQVHPAPQRHHYRQRLQLHYDQAQGQIGLCHGQQIVAVPHCQLPLPPLAATMAQLYQDPSSWQTKAPTPCGHLELAVQQEQVQWHWNRPYAADGFCQVNPVMNQQLKQQWQQIFQAKGKDQAAGAKILDLFGGQGNLSQDLAQQHAVLVVDLVVPAATLPFSFVATDLYAPSALAQVQQAAPQASLGAPLTWMIVDPPRAGFKQIAVWAKTWAAQNILYVSCNAATLARDLASLCHDYHLQQLHLFDFFPGTYHFETMAVLEAK